MRPVESAKHNAGNHPYGIVCPGKAQTSLAPSCGSLSPLSERTTAMHFRRVAPRVLVVVPPILIATVYIFTKEPVRGIDLGAARLSSSEPLAAESMESCRWDVAMPETRCVQ